MIVGQLVTWPPVTSGQADNALPDMGVGIVYQAEKEMGRASSRLGISSFWR
jgi:hypothetical protein